MFWIIFGVIKQIYHSARGNFLSRDWYFSQIPLPNMIYLFNILLKSLKNSLLFNKAVIMCPKRSLGDILCLLLFLLLLLFFFFFLSFFRQKFIRHISRRLLNGNQWNFTGMLSTMSRCADFFWNFQNGRRCHGNGQNAKELKNTKMIIAGYSPNRNWWNLNGTTSSRNLWTVMRAGGLAL